MNVRSICVIISLLIRNRWQFVCCLSAFRKSVRQTSFPKHIQLRIYSIETIDLRPIPEQLAFVLYTEYGIDCDNKQSHIKATKLFDGMHDVKPNERLKR